MTSASEQTSASDLLQRIDNLVKLLKEEVIDDPFGMVPAYLKELASSVVFTNEVNDSERPSPQQQPDKCPQCNGNGGGFTDNGWEACQPDELSKAQDRIRELEAALKEIRSLGGYGSTNVIIKRMFQITKEVIHD